MDRYYIHKIENLININKIVTIHYMECEKNFSVKGETHDFWELLYVDKGEIFVKADTQQFLLHEGEIIFHKPNEFHAVKADGKTAPNLFIISFVCSSQAINILQNKHFMLPKNLKHYITSLLNEAYNTFIISDFNPELKKLEILSSPILGGQQMILTFLQQFLIELIRNENLKSPNKTFYMTNEEVTNVLVQNIIALLKNNLDKNLSLPEICSSMNYSKTYLCKIFKQYTDKTIMNYYTQLKLQKAKQLLREHNLNCSQISDLLGYDNPAYFSAVFSKHFKISPSKYITSTSSKNIKL